MFIIDFDKLHLGELFEVFSQRARNIIERTIRLAFASQIHVCNAIRKRKLAVTGETVEDEGQSLVTFDIARSLEEFIEHRT